MPLSNAWAATPRNGHSRQNGANLVNCAFPPADHFFLDGLSGEPWCPESRFRAADAPVSCHYRPRDAVIESNPAAIRIRIRPLASNRIQAPTFLGALISPFIDELSCIKMGSSFAKVMNALSVCPDGPAQRIQRWHRTEHQIVENRSGKIHGIGGAPCNIDRFHTNRFTDPDCIGGIGSCSWYIPVCRACTNTNHGSRLGSHLLGYLDARSFPFGPKVRYFPVQAPRNAPSITQMCLPLKSRIAFPGFALPDSRTPPSRSHGIRGIWCQGGCRPHSDRTSAGKPRCIQCIQQSEARSPGHD